MQRIFVGDVQGCGTELRELIDRSEREFGDDFELWLVGDLINRGPQSRVVLAMVRELWERGRARPILGNHELALLRLDFGLREEAKDDTFQEILAAPDAREWVDWLRSWPLVRSTELGDRRCAMVHASVAPGWTLDELLRRSAALEMRLHSSRESARAFLVAHRDQDPEADDLERLTRCRSASIDGAWSSREPETPEGSWHAAWAKAEPSYGVIYGHWARQGLHRAPGLRGLDTGCVYHGNGRDGYLTAWVPNSEAVDPFAIPDPSFWQVRAKRRYWSA